VADRKPFKGGLFGESGGIANQRHTGVWLDVWPLAFDALAVGSKDSRHP